MRAIIHFTLITSLGTALLFGQALPQPQTFLRKQLAFTTYELDALDKGEIIVKLPKTAETREVAAFAIMRLDISADFFVTRVHDIVTFKKSDNVLQIGKFSNPPRLEDLSGLSLDPAEIERAVDEAIAETAASGAKDLGRVMKAVMPKLAGRAVDGKTVNELVRKKLA